MIIIFIWRYYCDGCWYVLTRLLHNVSIVKMSWRVAFFWISILLQRAFVTLCTLSIVWKDPFDNMDLYRISYFDKNEFLCAVLSFVMIGSFYSRRNLNKFILSLCPFLFFLFIWNKNYSNENRSWLLRQRELKITLSIM